MSNSEALSDVPGRHAFLAPVRALFGVARPAPGTKARIQALKVQWKELSAELKTIDLIPPEQITDRQWGALARFKRKPNVRMHNALYMHLPVVIGKFKRAAEETLMSYARARDVDDLLSFKPAFDETSCDVEKDMKLIGRLLLGSRMTGVDTDIEAEPWFEPRQACLHQDSPGPFVATGRLGNLASWYVNGHDQANMDRETAQLVKRAASPAPDGKAARDDLRKQGFMWQAGLNEIMLMMTERFHCHGNMHGSDETMVFPEKGGISSVFIRSFFQAPQMV